MHYSYFNSGVLLVNLEFWRKNNIPQRCIDFYHKYPERIIFNDQDLLNCILYKNKKLVSIYWNVQDAFYRNPKHITNEWKEKYEHVLKNPIVLHYTNRKPWDYDSQHPLREEYFKYLDMTPWKGERPSHSIFNRCKRFFKLLPFHLGIRKARYVDLSK
jgi:lipopolysaccharide biosynthesis glycosyltransferase